MSRPASLPEFTFSDSHYASLNPFPFNDEVLRSIRPMEERDCPVVAELHRAAMGHSLWARLGLPFLRTLYSCLLQDKSFVAYVYEEASQPEGPLAVGGFIAGSTSASGLMARTFIRHFRSLLFPFLWGVLRSPGVLLRLITTSRYFHLSDVAVRSAPNQEAQPVPGESLFCSFRPHLRGKKVSGHINLVLFEHFRQLGHSFIKITTECDNPGSNRQLPSWGFLPARYFSFYGKQMVTYVMRLESHPRLMAYASMKGHKR